MPKPAPQWQFSVAYALLALPVICVTWQGAPHPVPNDYAVRLYVCIGVAAGADVFIVRRRRRDVFGWAGVLLWGGGSVLMTVAALLR